MLVFAEEAAALAAAVDLLGSAPAPLRLRAGVHAGEVMVTPDDLVGHVVNVAARVAGAAKGGQVLATSSTIEAAGDLPDVRVLRPRRRALKGVADKIAISRIEPRLAPAAEAVGQAAESTSSITPARSIRSPFST